MFRVSTLFVGAFLTAISFACVPVRSGRATVSWVLTDSASNSVGCLPGDEVHLVIGRDRFIAPCSDGTLTTLRLSVGSYDAQLEYHLGGQSAATVIAARQVSIFRDAITEVGVVPLVVAEATGSATFAFDIHETYLEAEAVGCYPDESIYIEIEGLAPVTADCVHFGSQPITGIPPGPHSAYVALSSNGVVEDDPRPGYGNTEVTVDFTVTAGLDTPIHVDFVVAARAARAAREAASLPSAAPIDMRGR